MPKIAQAAFTAGELDPSLHARVDLEKYFTGLVECTNYVVQPQGGLVNRSGFKYVCAVKDSTEGARLIPFKFNANDTYMLVFNDGAMRVISNGALVLLSSSPASWVTATAYSVTDHVESGGTNYYCYNAHTSGASTEPGVGGSWSSYWHALEDDIVEIPIPYAESQLPGIDFVQSADVINIVHEEVSPRVLSRTANDKWQLTPISFTPGIGTPTGLSGSGGSGTSYDYVVTATASETLEEGLPSGAAANLENGGKLTWTDVSGAIKYNVYKRLNGIYGFIGTSSGGGTGFVDTTLLPITDDTPPAGNNPFSGAGDYPQAVAYHEQRLAFAGTVNTPQGLWFSQTGSYFNFSVSEPAKDADALTLRIITNEIAPIQYLISQNDLLVMTEGADIKVSSGDNAFILENIKRRLQGKRGCARVKPIQVGSATLFIQAGGSVVRDLQFSFESDSYTGGDLTILAKHLFRKQTVKYWDYQQDPHSVVWAVRSDGDLIGMTYLREHQILGWHRHTTPDGNFECVSVVPESNEFATYVIVKRSVNGADVRYVERLSRWDFDATDDVEDATFLDSHLTGTITGDTITGLDHLEGEDVGILIGGDVYSGTVSSGSVTVARSYTSAAACVGLNYVPQLKTLEPPIQDSFGREKTVSRVQIRVLNTRGIWAGPTENELVEYPTRQYELYGQPNQPITDSLEIVINPTWQETGQIVIQQPDPLPQNILAVMPDVEVGG